MADVPSLLPAPRLPAAIEPRLVELAEQTMLSPARQAGYELRLVGATVLPQCQKIERTPWGAWVFVDHLKDPTATKYTKHKIPMPVDQIARLEALKEAGVRPHVAWLAHQLPDSYRDGDPLPQLVPPPRHLREKDQRMALRLGSAMELFFKGAAALLTAAASPLALGLAAGAGLDPIILGGVKHPDYPVVQWVLLAQWDWE